MSGAYPAGDDAASIATEATEAMPAPVDPRVRARLAAEARSRLPPSNPSSTAADAFSMQTFVASAQDKLPFHRLLDTQLLPKCSIPQRVKTLQMLGALTGNILSPPTPAASSKYRSIRLSNTAIARNIVDVPGAEDYLVACGFRKSIVDFIPYLTFSPAPSAKLLHSLRVGHHVLDIVAALALAAEERATRYRADEKSAESIRVERTMLAFEEDRRLKKEKDSRDKIVRDSRAAQEAAEIARLVASSESSDYSTLPPATIRSSGAMKLDDNSDDDDSEGSDETDVSRGAAPTTMTGSARVLSTGEYVASAPLPRHGAGSGGRGRGNQMEDEDEDDL